MQNPDGTWSWSYSGIDDLAATTVTITATDDDGGSNSVSFDLSVSNVAPTPSIVSIGAVREEGTAMGDRSHGDGSGRGEPLSYAWAVYVDGGAAPAFTGSGSDWSFTPINNGSYRIVLSVSDEDGSSTNTEQTITVNNVAPLAVLSGDSTGFKGGALDGALVGLDGASVPPARCGPLCRAGASVCLRWSPMSPADSLLRS